MQTAKAFEAGMIPDTAYENVIGKESAGMPVMIVIIILVTTIINIGAYKIHSMTTAHGDS